MDKDRLEASRALGHMLPGHVGVLPSNTPILVCLATDTVPTVMARVVKEADEGVATLAVYWPDSGRMNLIRVSAADDTGDVQPVGKTANIGMISDSLQGGYLRFSMPFLPAAELREYAHA